MAIQFRQGLYVDFTPGKLIEGEPAVVLNGDPNTYDGKAFYIGFGSNTVKRVLTAEEFDYSDSPFNTKLKQDGIKGIVANRRTVCSTAASTATKTASITAGTFVLEAGARVTLSFTYENTADNPTLNINETGAKDIYFKGTKITTGSEKGLLSSVVDVIYDGSHWDLIASAPVIDNITEQQIAAIVTGVTPQTIDYLLTWCFPVGSYYETSFSNFDPNQVWGGTWVLDPDANSLLVDENAATGTVDADLAAALTSNGYTNLTSTNAVYRWHRIL